VTFHSHIRRTSRAIPRQEKLLILPRRGTKIMFDRRHDFVVRVDQFAGILWWIGIALEAGISDLVEIVLKYSISFRFIYYGTI
jgi:hypothetical protein